ncbi:Zinc-type alcohol dehydrogenase-like protein [Bacillus sp. THAF10]|uniref:zinc-binding dehydrogenase n=1 Tax=Bacillus sp. THAF10 TaxID=2587848 RepID=UPI001269817C|nr:zinc-binding dehydrogenase [Bacillus sp. THAF10]QFT91043.1 Zinc-type alcohol dehydrogenase-like protein [Bacillus sp. THAF10]
MNAWLLTKAGSLDNLVWGEIDTPMPEAGELLVKVKAVALNPVDYKVAINGNPAWSYPHIVGVDLAGEVVEIGQDVVDFKAGDRVAVHTNLSQKGAFAEFAAVDARATALIPDGVSLEDAAAILCAGMTAYEAVVQKLNTTHKQNILIHAGAGGVGGFAIQLAKLQGLHVFTTASSENHEWVKNLGADVAIDYHKEDVTERILAETNGRGADLILNTVGREVATEDVNRLAFSGHLAYIAGAPDLSNVKPFSLSPSIHEVALGAAHASKDERAIRNLAFMAEKLMELVQENKLNTLISNVIERESLVEGLKALQGRHVRGKIIVKM